MKEFNSDLSEVILQGLRPERRDEEDTMVQCFNGVPEETGVKPFMVPTLYFATSCSYPAPPEPPEPEKPCRQCEFMWRVWTI